jgi:hypothetical protein
MSKTITPNTTADGAPDYEAAIEQMFVEMRRANGRMEQEQQEIERLRAETREILARLEAA